MNNQHRHLLVTIEWLRDSLSDESVVVLDVRPSYDTAAYRQAHVPGALPFSLSHTLGMVDGTPGCLIEEAMVRQLSTLGVRPDQTVVLYDDSYSTVLTQSYWAFERVGQREVLVLEGGFQSWLAVGAPVDDRFPEFSSTSYILDPCDSCLATAGWIASYPDGLQLLDARSRQEWSAAHLPGATSCCWEQFLDKSEPPALLPLEQMAAVLDAASLSPECETVTYCRTGARASFVYFTLRLLGWKRVRNYEGSLTDWLLREQPVERS